MTVTRTAVGLLFRDTFDRANGPVGADWTAPTLGAVAVIEANAMKVTVPGLVTYPTIELAAVTNIPQGAVIQFRIKQNDADIRYYPEFMLQAVARWQFNAGSGSDGARGYSAFRVNADGSSVLLSSPVIAAFLANYHRFKSVCRPGSQRIWFDNTLVTNTADAGFGDLAGKLAFQHENVAAASADVFYEDVVISSSNSVVCTNLPAGYKLRVGTLVAVEVAGTATLDLAGTALPAALVEILNPANVVVDSFAGVVWGGDTYLFNTAPTAPDITNPVATSTHDASILVGWAAATDLESDSLQYEGDYSLDGGGSWLPLFPLQAALTYLWNTSAIADQTDVQVRVRAHDGTVYGPYDQSGNFTIAHNDPPVAPTVAVEDIDLDRATFISSAFSDPDVGDTHDATRWQVAYATDPTFTDPVWDSDWGSDLLEVTRTGLPHNEDLLVRAAHRDVGGIGSGFGAATAFTTALQYSCITPLRLLRELSDTYRDQILAAEPYLYYRLNEDTDAVVAADDSGNVRHGTYGDGTAEWGIPGAVEGDTAIRTDGVVGNIAVHIPSAVNDDLRRSFTYAFWAKPEEETDLTDAVGGSASPMEFNPDNRWLIHAQHGGFDGTQAGVGVVLGTNGIGVAEAADFYMPMKAKTTYAIGNRYVFVVIRVQGMALQNSSDVDIFIDGVDSRDILDAVFETADTDLDRIMFASNAIGSEYPLARYGRSFTGPIDEFAYYDRALTDEEITSLSTLPTVQEEAFDCVSGSATTYDCDEDAPTVAIFTEIE